MDTSARSKRTPRVLFLPIDGRGLGHLSRMCKLAHGLRGQAACAIATGLPYGAHLVPAGAEYVQVPGMEELREFRAAKPGRWGDIDERARKVLASRSEFFLTLERDFAPDLIVTDNYPTGWNGELTDMLTQSRARKLIVLRPVVGDRVVDAMRDALGPEALGRLYDAVLIAGDRRTAVLDELMRFTGGDGSATHYIGYVSIPVSQAEIMAARQRRGVGPGERWVVCSAGSGFYNRHLIADCLGLSREFGSARFDLVVGPSGSPPEPPDDALLRGTRIQMVAHRPDLRLALAAADIVISHGGYNTLTEAMEGGASLIVDVRGDVFRERARHATRLQRYYPIAIAEDAGGLARHLRRALAARLERRSIRGTAALDFDGCREFGRLVLEDGSLRGHSHGSIPSDPELNA